MTGIPLPPSRPVDFVKPQLAPAPDNPPPVVVPSVQVSPRPGTEVPLPPSRPGDLAKPQVAPKSANPSPAVVAQVAPPPLRPDSSCPRVLADKNLDAAPAAAIVQQNGCGILAPVILSAVILDDGTRVPFEPPSTIRCDLAEALGAWVREDIAPAVAKAGGLAKILGSNGYECRTRNHLGGEKLSEHAKGNALDIKGLVLRNGTQVLIEKTAPDKPAFLARIKAGACARFMTVLGPGADAFHEAHLHLDLETRHHNFRICEWDVN